MIWARAGARVCVRLSPPRVARLLRLFFSAIVAVSLVLHERSAQALADPRVVWKAIETRHFRISYVDGAGPAAAHVAEVAEAIHERLSPSLGWEPFEKVEIALTDGTDSANGLTGIVPYNEIQLFMTAPDDLSPLGDVDDWYLALLTHEYTHTLHIDQIRGLPALYNKVLGKTAAPNQVQPRWFIEGLATYMESARTSGGRLRSATWNMFMRADVLENNLAPLDVFSSTPRRWPQGNIVYLYGSFFLQWLAETYGEKTLRAIIDDYGRQVVPFAFNRSVRRATGKTYEELYPEWVASLRSRFGKQVDAVRKKGLREGRRITYRGGNAEHPVWVPANGFSDYAGELVYFRDDLHSTAGLSGVHLERDASGAAKPAEGSAELLVRTSDASTASFAPDGSLVFESVAVSNRLYNFSDLFRLPAGVTSTGGLEDARERLTTGMRARSPAVSPDGRRVVFSTQTRGTATMQLGDLGPEGITNIRPLVASAPQEQVFHAEWSPDNRHVAYSVWRHGGYRDIRYVDVLAGTYVDITSDRAIDSGPSFTADGRWLLFHSDRTKIVNVFAWETKTGRLVQVTNVLGGAYQPAVSPDGKTLAYVGYTKDGFDLYAMPFAPDSAPLAEPYIDDRPLAPPPPPKLSLTPKPYSPLHTLRPRRYSLQTTPGNYGQRLAVGTDGSDIAGHHAFIASLAVEVERPTLQFDVGYTYGRLPFDVSWRGYRSITPRGGYGVGPEKQVWAQEALGIDTAVSIPLSRAFESHSIGFSYSASRIDGELPIPGGKLDPYETPTVPVRCLIGALNVGWSYSTAQRFAMAVGPEKGFSTSANVSYTNPWLASDYTGFAASANHAMYFLMPWLRHHSVALHGSLGTSGGTFPGKGPFFVGGFVDFPVVDMVRNVLIQGGVLLRGYAPVALVGRSNALFNAEYRFPIVDVDRGLSTLPVFLQRISGAAFVDYGSAFNELETAKFKTGVGGELAFDTTLAHVVGFIFRLGYARGLASGGLDKLYFVAAVPY